MADNKSQGSSVIRSSVAQIRVRLAANPNLTCGLFTGFTTSALLNPVDKALYLSVVKKRPFFSVQNFANPLQGTSQAIVARGISSGLYYVFQGQVREILWPVMVEEMRVSEQATQCVVGLSAGSLAGFVTGPLSAIKYHAWSNQKVESFFATVVHMHSQGGVNPFLNGLPAIIARDMIFGSTYEVTRAVLRSSLEPGDPSSDKRVSLVCNGAAACVATLFSAPMNYVKNMQYATSPQVRAASASQILSDLYRDMKAAPGGMQGRIGFFQQRFVLGWVTARVGVGMALGQFIFDEAKKYTKPSAP